MEQVTEAPRVRRVKRMSSAARAKARRSYRRRRFKVKRALKLRKRKAVWKRRQKIRKRLKKRIKTGGRRRLFLSMGEFMESQVKEDTTKKVGEFEIVDHGLEGASYFQGHGVMGTEWDATATGSGFSVADAIEDAAEMLAQQGWEISAELDAEIDKLKREHGRVHVGSEITVTAHILKNKVEDFHVDAYAHLLTGKQGEETLEHDTDIDRDGTGQVQFFIKTADTYEVMPEIEDKLKEMQIEIPADEVRKAERELQSISDNNEHYYYISIDVKDAEVAEESAEELTKTENRCWDGYKPVPGKKAYEKGSCVKESKQDKDMKKLSESISKFEKGMGEQKGMPEVFAKIQKLAESLLAPFQEMLTERSQALLEKKQAGGLVLSDGDFEAELPLPEVNHDEVMDADLESILGVKSESKVSDPELEKLTKIVEDIRGIVSHSKKMKVTAEHNLLSEDDGKAIVKDMTKYLGEAVSILGDDDDEPTPPKGGKKKIEESKKSLSERGDKGLIENHPEWAEIVKEKVQDAIDQIERKYETFNNEVEEIEHQSRDGFISSNDGGYYANGFANLNMLVGSGAYGNLPKKAVEAIDRLVEYNRNAARENFIEKHAEELKGIPEDKINYHDLQEMGKEKLAEKLDEYELEALAEDTVMFQVRAMYEDPNEMTVQVAVNWESPYHRPSGKYEVYHQETFEFEDADDLRKQLTRELNKGLDMIGAGGISESIKEEREFKAVEAYMGHSIEVYELPLGDYAALIDGKDWEVDTVAKTVLGAIRKAKKAIDDKEHGKMVEAKSLIDKEADKLLGQFLKKHDAKITHKSVEGELPEVSIGDTTFMYGNGELIALAPKHTFVWKVDRYGDRYSFELFEVRDENDELVEAKKDAKYEKLVKALKKKKSVDNPWALAHWILNKQADKKESLKESYNEWASFVKSELSELESRDADQLFDMLKDNLEEMGVKFDETLEDELHSEIEKQLAELKK